MPSAIAQGRLEQASIAVDYPPNPLPPCQNLRVDFRATLDRIASMQDLNAESAKGLMEWFVSGQASDLQIAAALTALRCKGATSVELAAFAKVVRDHAELVDCGIPNLVDTCGTGGGIASFNISTAAAIIASAAGAPVAKHGNRAVTSTCGSADVLEHLGVRLGVEPEHLLHQLDTAGLAFLFAPAHHPALRAVAAARKELGIRTVFNQLGPLANPADAKRQLIGVYDRRLAFRMAEALAILGCERAFVVHGADGLDEISPCAATFVAKQEGHHVTELELHPKDFGLEPLPREAILPGADIAANAQLLLEAITDPESPRSQAAIPSAAAALWLADVETDLSQAAERARVAVRSGAARAKLELLVAESNL